MVNFYIYVVSPYRGLNDGGVALAVGVGDSDRPQHDDVFRVPATVRDRSSQRHKRFLQSHSRTTTITAFQNSFSII